MSDQLKADSTRCDVCRTINLANHAGQSKPDMQMYDKSCAPTKIDCIRVTELPLQPTCIKVCSKEEYKLRKSGQKKIKMPKIPYAHGKLMYATKAAILVGTVYFTYSQGVWGDQQDVTECIRRWQEYIRSLNTRRPPAFDQCGNVICEFYRGTSAAEKRGINYVYGAGVAKESTKKDTTENLLSPIYHIYKEVVTTCFSGVVKMPLVIKCAYVDYLKALERKQAEDDKERRIKRRG